MNPADVATTAAAATPVADVTVLGMFMQASFLVKLVMLALLGCSIWSWAIIVNKSIMYARVQRAMDKFEQVFWSGTSLEELYSTLSARPAQGMASLFVAAMREWKRSIERNPKPTPGTQLRVEKVMDVTISREIERLERRLTFLATVGSTAPFVGLFGTVWGIMRSFTAIAGANNTSLAVVAPGIAEALFATAIGLFAAIPALIAYNRLTHGLDKLEARLGRFADRFHATLSRELELEA